MADNPRRLSGASRKRHSEWIRRSHEQFGDVETAAELSPAPTKAAEENSRGRIDSLKGVILSAGRSLGWTAVVFAVLSWLIWPAFMGITAAVLGYFAYFQGSRFLGGIAMAMGGIAAAVYLILLPLYIMLG
jgi:hypothetical protein